MSSNANLRPYKVWIHNTYLYNCDPSKKGLTEGTLIGVRSQNGQCLQFQVLLESGALFTGLPSSAICWNDKVESKLDLWESQYYDGVSNHIEVIEFENILYAPVSVLCDSGTIRPGNYRFTIDFVGDGFSRCPENWKMFHCISTEEGHTLLYPQYRIKFLDTALCQKQDEPLPKYVANTKNHYFVGS